METTEKRAARERRHRRLRQRVRGTSDRPRLAVYRSNSGIYAQVIDDRAGRTLVAASSLDDAITPEGEGKAGVSKAVGKLLAERAQAAGITRVVFDRGGNQFQGRVRALAEGAREGGLEF